MPKKVKIQKENTKRSKETFWIVVAIISMTVYILWRIFFTIPDHKIYGWLATICGILLAVSESISMLEGSEHFVRLRKKVTPEMPVVSKNLYPHVDVLISTHNEEVSLLYKTINGCKHMDYPDKRKVHIYLCDDTNRPEMAKLAQELGVGYFGLSDNKLAKAGNLNNALRNTSSPWIATFDADMIPTRNFLLETVPYTFLPVMKKQDDGSWVMRTEEEIDPKYKIGFIQTPQSFYNPDLFQFNFYSEMRIPNEQDYFFREVNVGRNASNAPIYAGSNTLISRQALDEVGGIAEGTITEDFETGINIQAKGYTCFAVDKALAHGLAPTDVDSLIRQRVRWGRGCVSSLRHIHLLTNSNLKLNTKISYLSCWLYWWTFFRRFIYILSPVLFVLFNIPVVICSLPELIFIWLPSYVLYNHTLKVTSGKIRNKRWSNTVDTVIFPYMIIPIFLETLLIEQKKFNVTKKTRSTSSQNTLMLALPQMILLALDALALLVATFSALINRNYGAIIIIYWLAVNALHLIMAIFFMVGRRNLRTNDRFYVSIPVEITYMDKKFYGVTGDISETGMSILTDKTQYLPHGDDTMEIELHTDRYQAKMTARCVHVERKGSGWKYGIQILELSPEDKAEYFQILYDRDHTLAKVMHLSGSMFDDIFVNVQRRSVQKEISKRALPRVELNTQFQTVQGDAVSVADINYEYLRLQDASYAPDSFDLRIPGSSYTMQCKKSPTRAGLYYVENWRELIFHDVYEQIFACAQKEDAELAVSSER